MRALLLLIQVAVTIQKIAGDAIESAV